MLTVCFCWIASRVPSFLPSAVCLCSTMPIASDIGLREEGECNLIGVEEKIALNKALPVLVLIIW